MSEVYLKKENNKVEPFYKGCKIILEDDFEKIKSNIEISYYNLISSHIDKLNTNETRQKKLIELQNIVYKSKFYDSPILNYYLDLFDNYIKNNKV